jgi:hypothetical protein
MSGATPQTSVAAASRETRRRADAWREALATREAPCAGSPPAALPSHREGVAPAVKWYEQGGCQGRREAGSLGQA